MKFIAFRTVPDGGERDYDVANSILYAAENGAKVINMSFGKSYSPEKEAVDKAVQFALSKDVLFVHAAGNDGSDVDAEPNYPSPYFADSSDRAGAWIEVGASTWMGAGNFRVNSSIKEPKRFNFLTPGTGLDPLFRIRN